MRIFFFLLTLFCAVPTFSQTIYYGAVDYDVNNQKRLPAENQYENTSNGTGFKDSEQAIALKKNLKNMRGTVNRSPDALKARNLLILKKVLDFKIQDLTLKDEIAKLEENREFNAKLLNALNQLDNKKFRDRKNQEIINILNDAGNRIYNSLAN